jgi:hypothetical protein
MEQLVCRRLTLMMTTPLRLYVSII